MFSWKNMTFIALSGLMGLYFVACSGGGGQTVESGNSDRAGYWIEEFDLQARENLEQPDGSCRPYEVQKQDDLGVYYLEVIQVDGNGRVFNIAAVDKDTLAEGDFYQQGTIAPDGKFTLESSFTQQWSTKNVVFKEFDAKIYLDEDKNLVKEIINQVVVIDGEENSMKDVKDKYFKLTEVELRDHIAFAKSCAANQTLAK